MDKQSKAYLLLLYIIWPVSTFYFAIKFFDFKFGRKLLVLLYGFLGFTALSFGDLNRYEREFYLKKGLSFSSTFETLISLQENKFYNSFLSIFSGIFFETHHYYFSLLFMVYGFFLVHILYVFKVVRITKLSKFGLLFFLGILMWFLIRPLPNLAFYTGGLFVVYNLICYFKTKAKKYLFLILLVPIFHIGLTIFIILPVLLLIFKNRVWFYVLFVFFSLGLGQSSIVGVLGNLAESNSGTVLESKYNAYASEEGQEHMEKRYEENSLNYNGKLKLLLNLQNAILYIFVPIGMVILFLQRKQLLMASETLLLYNIVLSCWGVSNLMLNISQGERFLMIFSFIAAGLFFYVYLTTSQVRLNKYFNLFLTIFVPVLFIYSLMALIASHFIISPEFFLSNVIVEIISK
jgi:hypothetical protein